MKTVSKCKRISNGHNEKISAGLREEISRSRNKYEEQPLDIKASLLQELKTLGLMLVHEELEREISRLVGNVMNARHYRMCVTEATQARSIWVVKK